MHHEKKVKRRKKNETCGQSKLGSREQIAHIGHASEWGHMVGDAAVSLLLSHKERVPAA
jgi:hypothetical protein